MSGLKNWVSTGFLLLSVVYCLGGCGAKNQDPSPPLNPFGETTPGFSEESNLYVMSYNLHNLFDTQHDIEEGVDKNDIEFLPFSFPDKVKKCDKMNSGNSYYADMCKKTDWTAEKLNYKLGVIRKVVLHKERIPDILGTVEIENRNVAQMLADRIGYKTFVMTKGPDKRGIDVALFYNPDKLELIEETHIAMRAPEYSGKPTRDSLLVHFQLKDKPGQVLAVSLNHWPSQGNSDESRTEVAKVVMEEVASKREKYLLESWVKDYHFIMMGDFNTVRDDRPHPFNDVVLNGQWGTPVSDIETLRNAEFPNHEDPAGSYFYRPRADWNKLDRFFVSQSLVDKKGTDIMVDSFHIVHEDFMMRDFEIRDNGRVIKTIKIPNGFRHEKNRLEDMGVSDHLPIEVKIGY